MSGAATAIGIGAAIGGVGSVAGAAISSNAASDAASQQSQAAAQAAQLQYQASQNALNFQQNQYTNTQAETAPWLQSGSQALSNLNYLLGNGPNPSSLSTPTGTAAAGSAGTPGTGTASTPGYGGINAHPGQASPSVPTASGISPVNVAATPNTSLGAYGSLMQPYGQTFTAPTAAQMEASAPGYQARMQLGEQALQQSAAASGNLLTGGTAEALNAFAQNYASNEYQNYYNQAYNTYASNYNQYEQNQANQYNRLASLAGVGQQTASTLGTLGQNTANGVSSTLQNAASGIGSAYQNAAAANASGIVGSANAWSGALGSTENNLSNLYMMQNLFGSSGSNPYQTLHNAQNAGPVQTYDTPETGYL